MPAKRNVDRALAALASQDAPGKLEKRLESAIDITMDEAIRAVAEELAQGGDPRMFRSRAARLLITKGAAAMIAERRKGA